MAALVIAKARAARTGPGWSLAPPLCETASAWIITAFHSRITSTAGTQRSSRASRPGRDRCCAGRLARPPAVRFCLRHQVKVMVQFLLSRRRTAGCVRPSRAPRSLWPAAVSGHQIQSSSARGVRTLGQGRTAFALRLRPALKVGEVWSLRAVPAVTEPGPANPGLRASGLRGTPTTGHQSSAVRKGVTTGSALVTFLAVWNAPTAEGLRADRRGQATGEGEM